MGKAERIAGTRAFHVIAWTVIVLIFSVRLFHLSADYTTDYDYSRDGVLYTDEGWYSANAYAFHELDGWYRPGELNFAVNLPILQIMHGVSFSLFGSNITAARLTIIFSLVGYLAFLYVILRRFVHPLAGMLAVLWIATNYFMFLHSRFALGEIPLTFLLLAGIYTASFSNQEKYFEFTILGTILCCLAFYTKTNAIVGFPVLGLTIVAVNWDSGFPWKKALVSAGTLVLCYMLHFFLLARPYAEDYEYFLTLNIGANAKFSMQETFGFMVHLVDKMQLIDKPIYDLLFYLVPFLFIVSGRYRKNPLVLLSLGTILMYIVMLSLYSILRPRYWPVIVAPVGILLVVSISELLRLSRKHSSVLLLVCLVFLCLVLSCIRNLSQTVAYFRDVDYSFSEMSAQIKETLDNDPDSRNVLLGHFSNTISLYEDIVPVNDRFAPTSLEERIEEYKPLYLVTESGVLERDHANQWATISAEEGGIRMNAISKYYDRVELIKLFDTFDNYKDWPVGFYRLHPRQSVDETWKPVSGTIIVDMMTGDEKSLQFNNE